MKYIQMLALLGWISLFISCNDSDQILVEETLIFGHFFGECVGERCVETFRLTRFDLAEDNVDGYASDGPFDFEVMPQEKFELVKNLISEIPSELLETDDQTFGCPDCGDWGGIYVSWITPISTQSWRIDMIQESIPEYLHDFVDKINESIVLISD